MQPTIHNADGVALGFYFQAFFALETLVSQSSDDAAVAVEALDDVELNVNGQKLLYQLKHSISETPATITLKSRTLWRTIKVWADLLPNITLSETTLHLISVGSIPNGNALNVLTDLTTDRSALVSQLIAEANRVVGEREKARLESKQLPYTDRSDGCEALLAMSPTQRSNLFRRILIRQGSPSIGEIEARIATYLVLLPVNQRPIVAARLIEWWDRQIVYSLCGRRERAISRTELQAKIMSIVGDLDSERLIPEFQIALPPDDYQPDGLLARQIKLVEGKPSDINKAIREEWRARSQRSSWINANPGMAVTILDYDQTLKEYWADIHTAIQEQCGDLDHQEKCRQGLDLLRWTHDNAPGIISPIATGWTGSYYVRGSYQILAINLSVGWHPDYLDLLNEE
jgi:hypothetical protein